MQQNQTLQILKKPLFWLFVILITFFLKGVFLVILFPIFQFPDEQTHFAQTERWAEPKEKNWEIKNVEGFSSDSSDIRTYHYPEEIINSGYYTQFDEVKSQKENTQAFTNDATGLNEKTIAENSWKQYLDLYPSSTADTWSVYYLIGSWIEHNLANTTIFTRLFSVRFLSVIFGTLVILLSYSTAKIIGFSERKSLIITALVAFQPMFAATAAMVNIDIALIFSFSFFIYAAISLLKSGFSLCDITLLLLAIILGIFSKGPGIVLVVASLPLIAFLAYDRFKPSLHKLFWQIFLSGFLIIASVFLFIPQEYLISITNISATSKFDSPIISLSAYASKTLDTGSLLRTESSYWGNFGWLDTKISDTIIKTIALIELVSLIGMILYLVSGFQIGLGKTIKKWFGESKEYLPERKYIVLFLGMMLALQLAIRFYDWRIFDAFGKIYIGQPGRYFLPNIIPHIIMLVTGLGFFTRNKRQFDILLRVLTILMILLSLYSIVDVIIPRYYL
jgi:4-amino-4-deoxy-L-arabinose transferase-like glycosyltransferase